MRMFQVQFLGHCPLVAFVTRASHVKETEECFGVSEHVQYASAVLHIQTLEKFLCFTIAERKS